MKIAIIGYSGAGKSTLARKLGKKLNADVLHLDSIGFKKDWVKRDREEQLQLADKVLKKDSWVVDGNWSKIYYERRMNDADKIIFLNFNRFYCLKEAYKRYRKYKNGTRPDIAEGCQDKFDMDFALWILKIGRKKSYKNRYKAVCREYSDKVLVFKNRKQVVDYINSFREEN